LDDSVLTDGTNCRCGLVCGGHGAVAEFDPPSRKPLKRGFWGVGGGIACDGGASPVLKNALEDTPFYRRSLVETVIAGDPVEMMHETLDCRRLANPVVRMMLPFRMPRRA
ncbi:MAG: carotenoid 1,2-hydratase, partial [Allorhizobium sp.]